MAASNHITHNPPSQNLRQLSPYSLSNLSAEPDHLNSLRVGNQLSDLANSNSLALVS